VAPLSKLDFFRNERKKIEQKKNQVQELDHGKDLNHKKEIKINMNEEDDNQTYRVTPGSRDILNLLFEFVQVHSE